MSPTPAPFLGRANLGHARFALSLLAAPLALTLVGRLAGAQTIVAPTAGANPTPEQASADSAALKAAIAAAASGSVIWVQGGTYDGPFVIDKPLTLVASPQAHLRHGFDSEKPCVQLAGSGGGAVRLAGFKLGEAPTNVASPWIGAHSYPAISGQGFEELDIVRCRLRPNIALALGIQGSPAISVTIPLVVAAHSDFESYRNVAPSPYFTTKNEPAIAVNGSVLVMDSMVKGADAIAVSYLVTVWYGNIPMCPCPNLFGSNHSGGDGIQATKAFVVNSTVVGGKGGAVTIQYAPAGFQPDGEKFSPGTEAVELPNTGISAPAALTIGSSWTLDSTWSAELYGALGLTAPWEVLGQGSGSWAFIRPRHIAHLTQTGLTVAWPSDTSWIGTPLAVQAYDPVLGLSRPVFDIFMP